MKPYSLKRLTQQLTFANGKSIRSKRYKLLADHFGQLYVADLATYKPEPSTRRPQRTKGTDKIRIIYEPDEVNKALQQEILRVAGKKEALLLSTQVFSCSGKSHHNVVHTVRQAHQLSYGYVLKLDISSAFDSVCHDLLKIRVHSSGLFTQGAAKFALMLVLVDVKKFKRGIPQGHPLSTTLFNLFMQPLDNYLIKKGYHWYRYVDDIGVFFPTVEEAKAAKQLIKRKLSKMGLTLHPIKTRIRPIDKTTLLSYRFKINKGRLDVFPSSKRFKHTIDLLLGQNYLRKKQGEDTKTLRVKVNKYIKSWIMSYPETNRKQRLGQLDKWVKKEILTFTHDRYISLDERFKAFKVLVGKDKLASKLASKINKNPIEILDTYTGKYSFRIRSIKDTFNSLCHYPSMEEFNKRK